MSDYADQYPEVQKELAKLALYSQTACNESGLAHSLAEAIELEDMKVPKRKDNYQGLVQACEQVDTDFLRGLSLDMSIVKLIADIYV